MQYYYGFEYVFSILVAKFAQSPEIVLLKPLHHTHLLCHYGLGWVTMNEVRILNSLETAYCDFTKQLFLSLYVCVCVFAF